MDEGYTEIRSRGKSADTPVWVDHLDLSDYANNVSFSQFVPWKISSVFNFSEIQTMPWKIHVSNR